MAEINYPDRSIYEPSPAQQHHQSRDAEGEQHIRASEVGQFLDDALGEGWRAPRVETGRLDMAQQPFDAEGLHCPEHVEMARRRHDAGDLCRGVTRWGVLRGLARIRGGAAAGATPDRPPGRRASDSPRD